MARVHSRAVVASRGELAGIASSTAASAQRAAAEYGFSNSYSSASDLLKDDTIDVIHICSPNYTHAELALAALEAGKHVVCEKPLATTAADAQRLAQRARQTGLVATVPFVYRYHPMVREARARALAGELGSLLTIQGSYLQDWLLTRDDDNWRVNEAFGGPSRAFADIGSHLCDLIEFITGDRVSRLAATTRTLFDTRANSSKILTEDAAALVMQTTSGAIGTVLVSQVAPGRKNKLKIEIAGTAESLVFDQENPDMLWVGRRAGSQMVVRDPAVLAPDAARLSVLPAGHPLGYQDAFTAFITDTYAAVRGRAPEGLPTFDDGERAARITAAVLESTASGEWADVHNHDTNFNTTDAAERE